MIKSRAVPEGFDTTRSLRSPYLRSRQERGRSLKAEEDNAHSCDTTCPPDENLIGSPSSISSNPDSFYAAASSVSTSEAMSPESSRRETPFPSDSSLSPRAKSQPVKRYSRSLSAGLSFSVSTSKLFGSGTDVPTTSRITRHPAWRRIPFCRSWLGALVVVYVANRPAFIRRPELSS